MNTVSLLQKASEDALIKQNSSTTSTTTSKITGCPICNSLAKSSTGESISKSSRLLERKCVVCGTNCGKPSLLDLFCCAGGAARGYQLAGFCVLGIDIKPQPHYAGCRFHQADALEYLAEHGAEFDVIHASPPCQAYANVTKWTGDQQNHPRLIAPTRELLIKTGKPWVMENVRTPEINTSVMLCGSMFGLRILRHRYFESPWIKYVLLPPCNHSDFLPFEHKGERAYADAMGCDWMNKTEARQAIPPAYTEFIGKILMDHLNIAQERND